MRTSRREFFADLGQGALALGMAPAFGVGWRLDEPLTFGDLEPLVAWMQETAPDALVRGAVEKLRQGTSLDELLTAAALANARTFGGEDYTGYHCAMALQPAHEMARLLPDKLRPLPVLKVLHRNATRIQEHGGRRKEVLHLCAPAGDEASGAALRRAMLERDVAAAESCLVALAARDLDRAYEDVQVLVRDDGEVHRIVLAWRAWDLLRVAGRGHGPTLLRQIVRFCVAAEQARSKRGQPAPAIRDDVPRLLAEHGLLDRELGREPGSDAWLDELATTICTGSRPAAAAAAAEALAKGGAPESVGEAISLAANRLLLHDPGTRDAHPGKPKGSVHGASIGVHASDSANAWRHVARLFGDRHRAATLVAAAWHTAGQSSHVSAEPIDGAKPAASDDADRLLKSTEECIDGADQAGACALVRRYGELGHPPEPVFELMLRQAIAEDGALHAEKYFWTVREEFHAARPAFRWRHLVGLARVTASQHGHPAAGVAAARELLGA